MVDDRDSFSSYFTTRNLVCQLETNKTVSSDRQEDALCASYLKNEKLILDDLKADEPGRPTTTNRSTTDYSAYAAYFLCFFLIGLKVGSVIVLVYRYIARKRSIVNNNIYVKFNQDADAISIDEPDQERRQESKQELKQSSNQAIVSYSLGRTLEQHLIEELNSVLKDRNSFGERIGTEDNSSQSQMENVNQNENDVPNEHPIGNEDEKEHWSEDSFHEQHSSEDSLEIEHLVSQIGEQTENATTKKDEINHSESL